MSLPTVEYGLMDIGSVSAPRVFATGPVATVYAGRHAGKEVAVKVFADRFDRDTVARLDRERRSLESQRCPAILGIDEIVETTDGRSGVRMALCRGSLADMLGALTVREALGIGSAITAALAAGHRVGIVHGAVTPHNVLHRDGGQIVLGDFGLALRDRFPCDPAHALEYLAPETLRENSRSKAADWYGLGAVLYAMLTGAPPFPRRTGQAASERILQVLREPAPPLPDAPAALSELVARLLAKDPADRPADASEVAAVLDGLRTRAEVEADGFDFDDFAAAGPASPAALTVPIAAAGLAVPAGRTLIHTTGEPSAPRRLKPRHGVLAGLGVLAVGLITLAPMLIEEDPARPGATPPAAGLPLQASPSAPVRIVLAPPADEGRQVRLAWDAEGDYDFAVVVAGEQIDTMVLVARRGRTLTVPVDPDRKYCFQVRGTDGRQIWSSEPVAIRGARCQL